jgi:hypothetical protein
MAFLTYKSTSHIIIVIIIIIIIIIIGGTGVWTYGLHLEPLYQSYICAGYFQDRVSKTICLGWPRTMILLISASWVAKMTGVSHLAPYNSYKKNFYVK